MTSLQFAMAAMGFGGFLVGLLIGFVAGVLVYARLVEAEVGP